MRLTEDKAPPSNTTTNASDPRVDQKISSSLNPRSISHSVRARLWTVRQRLRESLRIGRNMRFWFSGRCVVCHGKDLPRYRKPAIARLPFRFHICRDCDFIFVLPPKNLETVYEAHSIPDLGVEEWNEHYLRLINKHSDTKGTLLEIGFGTASFLKLAHDDGWVTYGVDLSKPQIEYAREVLKLPNITLGTIEEISYPDNFFDVVAGFNFLEHVPNPRKSLEEIRRILKPGGILALMCPNIAGIFHSLMPQILGDNDPLQISWVPPQHLSYFNKTNLRLLIDSCGFVIVEDGSHLMSCLWKQFEPQIGATVTQQRLRDLKSDIEASAQAQGDAKVAEFGERIKKLAIERMTWTMLSDFMEIESMLGAEVGTLLIAKKPPE